MVKRIESMSAIIVRFAYVLVFVGLVGEITCKPALDQDWFNLAPLRAQQEEIRPFYIKCLTSSECGKDHCCLLGRQRFSIPKCERHSGPGASCYPGSIALARNLSYPDGVTVKFSGVYDLFCPCSFGLHCDTKTNQCVEDHIDHGENSLDPFWLSKYNSLYDRRK